MDECASAGTGGEPAPGSRPRKRRKHFGCLTYAALFLLGATLLLMAVATYVAPPVWRWCDIRSNARKLGDSDPIQRSLAWKYLHEYGPAARDALIDQIAHGDPKAREYACDLVLRLQRDPDPKAMVALVGALDDSEDRVARHAARALLRARDAGWDGQSPPWPRARLLELADSDRTHWLRLDAIALLQAFEGPEVFPLERWSGGDPRTDIEFAFALIDAEHDLTRAFRLIRSAFPRVNDEFRSEALIHLLALRNQAFERVRYFAAERLLLGTDEERQAVYRDLAIGLVRSPAVQTLRAAVLLRAWLDPVETVAGYINVNHSERAPAYRPLVILAPALARNACDLRLDGFTRLENLNVLETFFRDPRSHSGPAADTLFQLLRRVLIATSPETTDLSDAGEPDAD
jgi:hypothetical protein